MLVATPKRCGGEAESSALEVIRWYLDSHGRLFEISENIHPAGRYGVTSVPKRVRQAEGFGLSQRSQNANGEQGGIPTRQYCGSLEVDRNENCAVTGSGRR
jgi:hypothetical protein